MLAAIDVGTNTVRMLLGEVRDGCPLPLSHHRRITRLGGQFSKEKGLAPDAMERTLFALTEFSSVIAGSGAKRVRAVGTQALRQAVNGSEFVRRIRDQVGLDVEIIDGCEEARLCTLGVLAGLSPRPESSLIFDIGGGSTEFVLTRESEILFQRSYQLGVVGLSENYPTSFAQNACIEQVLDSLLEDIAQANLGDLFQAGKWVLVGTAGTVTTLAALDLQMTSYDWRQINNHGLSFPTIQALCRALEVLDVDQREDLPGMEKGRGDLIVPGMRMVLALMRKLEKRQLTVSDFGLLEGVLLSLAGDPETCQ